MPPLYVQPMETSMRKTALTIFSALLISGLAVQTAAASEHHARFHRAYNQVTSGPMVVTPPRYISDYNGFSPAKDPSRPGGEDTTFRP